MLFFKQLDKTITSTQIMAGMENGYFERKRGQISVCATVVLHQIIECNGNGQAFLVNLAQEELTTRNNIRNVVMVIFIAILYLLLPSHHK